MEEVGKRKGKLARGVSVGNEGKREPRAWGVTVMIIIPNLGFKLNE